MSIDLQVLIAILAPAIGAPVLYLLTPLVGRKIGWLALLLPILSASILINLGTHSHWGTSSVSVEWVPFLGINLDFLLDGVSTFFSLVVSIMGVLVTFYAIQYLHEPVRETGRFFSYLMLFITAMLGTVLSNNIYLLFIFWELTGIASFLLIGFYYKDAASQRGSKMALLVTGGTGLIMFIGMVALEAITKTPILSEIVTLTQTSLYLTPSLLILPAILITIGAFGKSAQFPFHFWLPNAMAAPTPVSAYLHSAAMVKLGVFLIARMFPVFSVIPSWLILLTVVGFTTMTIGAILALLSNDFKGLLAYTTVSQLGFLVGFYGLGSTYGIEHDFFHIINHVFYKGCLFMVAGIVIHTMHTKDIRKISGLAKVMPLTAISCTLAAAGMAGIPGTSGFISKELMLASIFHTVESSSSPYAPLLLVAMALTAVSLFICSCRLIFNVFFGKPSEDLKKCHKPSFLFQLPPFILSLGVLAFGLFPSYFGHALSHLTTIGLHTDHPSHLAIWHGLSTELKMSLSIITAGLIGYLIANKVNWKFTHIPSLIRVDLFFDKSLIFLDKTSQFFTKLLSTDKPYNYLLIILSLFAITVSLLIYPFIDALVMPKLILSDIGLFELSISLSIIFATIAVVIVRSWIGKVIALSVVGLFISFYFILYKAPDLALTQLLIESVSLVLFLLLLSKIPKNFELKENDYLISPTRRIWHGLISLTVGAIMFSLILMTSYTNPFKIGSYFLKHTLPLAEGSNAVNTILVDFRGFDTMGEITVLMIATIGVIGLLGAGAKKRRVKKQ